MMAIRNNALTSGAGGLLLAAAAWPWIFGMATTLFLTPYERALRTAWCGVAPHTQWEILGHCPACWAGSMAFVAAALALLHAGSRRRLVLSFAFAR